MDSVVLTGLCGYRRATAGANGSRTPARALSVQSISRILLLLLSTLVAKSFADAGIGRHGKSENNGCSAVKLAYGTSLGFSSEDVPSKMVSGWYLRICPQGFTCCTEEMEMKLNTQSRQELDKIMADKIELLRLTFISRTAKFDAFFTELLDNAKQDLHNMFVRTYGLLYQQNSHVFTDLFRNLRGYYKGRDVNLIDVLDNFFATLLQKMFELLNSQYTFDDSYLQCVTEHMDELKPFGDVPQKLSIQVKRAFVAARTFVQGLAIGRDLILTVSKLQPSQSCNKAVMKMLYCPYCRGLPHVKPCNNYCMNVMKGCLAHHAELNSAWNTYIDELMKVADRLEGPFNIEMVVDPIDVKISDAIMNFQENSEKVTYKVFQGCGQPRIGRKKREVAAAASSTGDEAPENTNQEYQYNWNTQHDRGQYVRPTTAAGTSLDRLVRDIKKKIETTRDFWSGLPHIVCNDLAAPLYEEHNCWNGLGKYKYMPDVTADGLIGQINNPEVEVDIRKPNSVINQQILQLKLITNKLKNAYNGLDVDWIDTADVATDGSGSGSGSGSGFGQLPDFREEFTFTQPPNRDPVVKTRMPPRSEGGRQSKDPEQRPTPAGGAAHAHSSPFLLVLSLSMLTWLLWRQHFCCFRHILQWVS